jgi:hypothetical protein
MPRPRGQKTPYLQDSGFTAIIVRAEAKAEVKAKVEAEVEGSSLWFVATAGDPDLDFCERD